MFKNFNFSSFLTTMALYVLMAMGVNYFFFPSKTTPTAEEIAMQQKQPNRAVNFAEAKELPVAEMASLETDNCRYDFSNHGGVLAGLEFKKFNDKKTGALKTVHMRSDFERDQGMFLLVLDNDTPFGYTLVEKVDGHSVTYQAENADWTLKKKFTVNPGSYVVDLEISFIPKKKSAELINPRLFFAAPLSTQIVGDASTGFVIAKDVASLTKTDKTQEREKSWDHPVIFGTEDKYFVHTLVGDHKSFFRNAYFSRVGANSLMGILQGAECAKEETITCSFYCGPKILNELQSVDPRLEDLLSFGWLSWICKLLLMLLTFFASFFNSYGLGIIIVAVLTRLVFLPVNMRVRKKMAEYQRFQPTLNAIRTKYRHDRAKQHEELMRFHKEHNISPATQLVGILQLFAQIPFFIGLSRLLNNYLALHQASFLWISDLSLSDPYYLLPIIMVIGTIVASQQAANTSKDGRQIVMSVLLALFMGAVFTNVAAGLALAVASNTLTAGIESYLLGLLGKKSRA